MSECLNSLITHYLLLVTHSVNERKLKTEAMELLRKLAPTVKAIESAIQKQAIADSSGRAAAVWDLGGQPASYSGKEYGRLFKEITGALS